MKIVTSYKLQVTSFLFLVVLLFPVFVFAQDQSIWSKGIVPCKGLDCSVCDVFKLVDNVIRLLWSGAALVGTLAFMYGGLLYWKGKPAEAKKVLTNVVIGIALAFLAWIGIDTIIKLLVTQRFTGDAASLPTSVQGGVVKYGPWNQINCQAVSTAAGQGVESGLAQEGKTATDIIKELGIWSDERNEGNPIVSPPPGVTGERMDANESDKRKRLQDGGVSVNNPDYCPVGLDFRIYKEQNKKSCTSVGGLPNKTIDDLIRLNSSCDKAVGNCLVVVSGGNETGHKSHGDGKPIVDLRFDQKLADYFQSEAVKRDFGIQKICTTYADRNYRHNCYTFNEAVRHLHVEFSL